MSVKKIGFGFESKIPLVKWWMQRFMLQTG
jgi:hypothetical protein